jgi:hypothetical protein
MELFRSKLIFLPKPSVNVAFTASELLVILHYLSTKLLTMGFYV